MKSLNQVTLASLWVLRQWLTTYLPNNCASIQKSQIGLTAIASFYLQDTALCCFMPCFICLALKMSAWRKSKTSVNGALRHQVTQSLVIRLELMQRLDHWDKGFLQRLDLLKQSVSWLLSTTVMVIRFSTITLMSSVVMVI